MNWRKIFFVSMDVTILRLRSLAVEFPPWDFREEAGHPIELSEAAGLSLSSQRVRLKLLLESYQAVFFFVLSLPAVFCQPEEWHKLWADFPGLGSWSKDLLNGCRSVVHRKTGTSQLLANLRMCPQTWTVCRRARTAASSSHQIVDWPYMWPECMEYEDLLHLTREGMAFAHRVNVASIPGCDLCTTCLTRVRGVWNGASCIVSL